MDGWRATHVLLKNAKRAIFYIGDLTNVKRSRHISPNVQPIKALKTATQHYRLTKHATYLNVTLDIMCLWMGKLVYPFPNKNDHFALNKSKGKGFYAPAFFARSICWHYQAFCRRHYVSISFYHTMPQQLIFFVKKCFYDFLLAFVTQICIIGWHCRFSSAGRAADL